MIKSLLYSLYTPTISCTFAGLGCYLSGLEKPAAILWVVAGVGGCAIALDRGIREDNKVWWWPSIFEEIGQMLGGKSWSALSGFISHAPMAAVGLWLLV